MSSPGTGQGSFVHAVGRYDGDQALLDLAVPAVEAGLAADEPVILCLRAHDADLVRARVGDHPRLMTMAGDAVYDRPAVAIRALVEQFEALLDGGAKRVHVVGSLPEGIAQDCWHDWLGYEVAVGRAFAPYPMKAVCCHDTRTTPGAVLDELVAVHPHLAAGPGEVPNPTYDGHPESRLHRLPAPPPDPLQDRSPTSVLLDPSPSAARDAARSAAHAAGLGARRIEDVLVVTSELVTNAIRYGRPPVTLELWHEPDRVLVAVGDTGSGPDDPLVGLVREDVDVGGMGLWIARQLADRVVLVAGPGGFTVRASLSGDAQRSSRS